MKTNCEINIPKKYQEAIKEVDYEGRENGYWVYLNEGYLSEEGYGSQTIHEYTKADVLKAIRKVVKVENEVHKEYTEETNINDNEIETFTKITVESEFGVIEHIYASNKLNVNEVVNDLVEGWTIIDIEDNVNDVLSNYMMYTFKGEDVYM